MDLLVTILEVVCFLGSGLVALKLYKHDLHRRYPALFVYFLFRAFSGIWTLALDVKSTWYFYWWMASAPMYWILYALVVLEIYRLALEPYKGLYSVGRWAMYVNITVSIGISALSLLPRIKPAMPQRSKLMGYVVAADRGVDFGIVLFILLMIVFLTRYPVPLSRNILTNLAVFSLYFLSTTLAMFLHTLFGLQLSSEISAGLLGASAVCVVIWLVLLGKAGEGIQVSVPMLSTVHEQRILRQLESLNKALLGMRV